jgi:hypothetical protein
VNSVGRAIGMDVHLEFCEVAVCEDGQVRSAGRVDAGGVTGVSGELGGHGSGRAGGDWRLLGGGPDPRAARREGDRREPG